MSRPRTLSYKSNSTNSNYAQHLRENSHTFPSIDRALHILEFQKKSIHMNTLEKFHIYKEAYHNNHLNDQHTVVQNKIFETIQKNEKHWDFFAIQIILNITTYTMHHTPPPNIQYNYIIIPITPTTTPFPTPHPTPYRPLQPFHIPYPCSPVSITQNFIQHARSNRSEQRLHIKYKPDHHQLWAAGQHHKQPQWETYEE